MCAAPLPTALPPLGQAARQRGVSLVLVLLILVGVSLLGAAAMRMAMLNERSARNERDAQMAFQAAQAALLDAELDLHQGRAQVRFDGTSSAGFEPGCAAAAPFQGLCSVVLAGAPAWMTVDFVQTDAAHSTALGTFTARTLVVGKGGLTPAQAPRYIIELVADPTPGLPVPRYLYLVTAVGFGPRADIQVALQALYRPLADPSASQNTQPSVTQKRLSWRKVENFQEINLGP